MTFRSGTSCTRTSSCRYELREARWAVERGTRSLAIRLAGVASGLNRLLNLSRSSRPWIAVCHPLAVTWSEIRGSRATLIRSAFEPTNSLKLRQFPAGSRSPTEMGESTKSPQASANEDVCLVSNDS